MTEHDLDSDDPALLGKRQHGLRPEDMGKDGEFHVPPPANTDPDPQPETEPESDAERIAHLEKTIDNLIDQLADEGRKVSEMYQNYATERDARRASAASLNETINDLVKAEALSAARASRLSLLRSDLDKAWAIVTSQGEEGSYTDLETLVDSLYRRAVWEEIPATSPSDNAETE